MSGMTMCGVRIYENAAPGVPLLSSDGVEFWNQAYEALGGPEDVWVDKFLNHFADPINLLAWDNEEGDYFWMWPKWPTEEAVDAIFSDLDYEAEEALINRLNDIAPDWVKISEMVADDE